MDRYSLPHIENLIFNLKNKRYFTKLDLKDGFFNIKLSEKDQHKTAFRYKHLLYEWKVMPMGFKNAPAIFQRYMDNILKDEIGKSCIVYVDDILIYGETVQEHDKNFEKVIKILKINNLTINENKTVLRAESVKFLGYIIEKDKIKTDKSRIQAIKDFPAPINKKKLQEFLGMINYCRKFIPRCATIAEPLYVLTKQGVDFIWSRTHEDSFQELKDTLSKRIELNQPDHNDPFILETDASDTGIGAILSQTRNNEIIPIAFASRSLNTAERKYSISEKECLAIVWATEYYKYYLYGKEFEIYTDHKALEVLNKGDIKSLRIHRWLEKLSNFAFTIKYKKGNDIVHVDAISRSFEDTNKNSSIGVNEIEIEQKTLTDDEKRKIIKDKHIELLHRGEKSVIYSLKKDYKWKNLTTLTRQIVNQCNTCKLYNPKKYKQFIFIKAHEIGEKVAIDIIGPINKTYIITGIDYFSRKGFAKTLQSRETRKVLEFIKQINNILNIKTLILDQSKENLSKEIKEYAKTQNINLHYTSPFHHQSNGRVERFNRTLQELIFKNNEKINLKGKLNKAMQIYNNCFHSSIGCTPEEALKEEFEKIVKQKQYDNILKYCEKIKESLKEEIFNIGDIVYIKNEKKLKGEPYFKERGKIEEELGNNAYLIKVGKKFIKRHSAQLKRIVDEVSHFIKTEEC